MWENAVEKTLRELEASTRRPVDRLIDIMIQNCREKLQERLPDIIDMYLLGPTDHIEVTFTGFITRIDSDRRKANMLEGTGISIQGESQFMFSVNLPKRPWWKRLWGVK